MKPKLTHTDIRMRFRQHDMDAGQHERYHTLQQRFELLAVLVAELTPVSREQSLALTKLEESSFWASAAIARHKP